MITALASQEAAAAPRALAARSPGWLDRQAYPFAPRHFAAPAGRMHYVDEGRGETLLFVHGTPTWSFEYRHLIRALSQTHRCVAPDHLGFGLSERPAAFGYTPEEHAANLAAFVDGLGLRDVTLVVHDYGGPIGLPLALDRPDVVKRLVVLNSWMWPFDDDPALRRQARLAGGWLGRLLYRRLNFSLRVLLPYAYGDRSRLTKEVHRQYLSPFPDAGSRGDVLWPLARALLGSTAHFRGLWERRGRLQRLPALVVWGLRDRALPRAMLDRWREVLPQAKVVPLEAAGHWPHEEDPAATLAALRAFLA